MNLQDLLGQSLGSDAVTQISQTLGTDEGTASNAIQAALPMLLTGLARNSSTPDGAQSLMGALERDHDGSVLDNLAGSLGGGGTDIGQAILGHIFGSRQNVAANGLSQASGLDAGRSIQLLALLAPIVMGALGRTSRQQGLDAGSLAGMLGGQAEQMAGNASPLLGALNQLLDADKDGSALDDIAGIAGRLFARRP
jgi:hypothetical protein